MALAADETSQLARKTSAPVTCLSVTRKGTASRIWKLGAQVKIKFNVWRLAFGVWRLAVQGRSQDIGNTCGSGEVSRDGLLT
jgi:hypothetical protein